MHQSDGKSLTWAKSCGNRKHNWRFCLFMLNGQEIMVGKMAQLYENKVKKNLKWIMICFTQMLAQIKQ